MRFGSKRSDPRPSAPRIEDVAVHDDVIRLGQFLKLANLVDSGSEAKIVIAEGGVLVDGEVELRRGRQLRAGDVVEYKGRKARVSYGVPEGDNIDVPW